MKRAAWVCLALGVAGVASCGKDSVSIVLLDPCAEEGTSFREAAAWTEIAVVRNGCPADEDLALGDVQGAVFRGTRAADGSLPEVGDLEKGKYGFVALLKDDNCGVIGFGCTAADLESIREVRIAVRAWTNPPNQTCTPLTGGACPAGLVCDSERGTCNPDTGSCDGGGTGCTLEVVTAGSLPKAAFSSSTVSGPAIVNTSCGFAVGYREYSSGDGTMQTTILPLSDAGALGAAATLKLMEPSAACSGKSVTDGIGMAFSGSQGLLVSSLPNCNDGKGAGAAFVPFSDDGGIKIGAWTSPRNDAFEELTLAKGHAVAPATQSNEWEFIYRAVLGGIGSIQRGIIQGNGFKATPPIIPSVFSAPAAFAQVATGGTARAFLGGNVVAGEAGTNTVVQLSRFSATSGDDATPVGEVNLPGGGFGALAAYDDRVVAGVPSASGLTWSVYEVSSTAVTNVVDQQSLGGGAVLSADVVEHNGSLIFALGKAGTITTHRFENASSSIGSTASDTGTLSAPTLPSGYDGQNVAIAAGRNRVAVAWITKASATSSDAVGGYALLQCAD